MGRETKAVAARLPGTSWALLAEPRDERALHPPFSWQTLSSHQESFRQKAGLSLDTFLVK